MNIQEYIDTGILEQYCLGILADKDMQEVEALCQKYPEIRTEIGNIEGTLEQYAASFAVAPPGDLGEKIWDSLQNLNKEHNINLGDLPLINRFTDHKAWLGIVKPFIPKELQEDRVVHMLRESDKVIQMLIISRSDFDDEVHVEEHESFIILEGECECTVGDKVFRMHAGEFTEIPLHTNHDVRVISPRVVAIVQRIAV